MLAIYSVARRVVDARSCRSCEFASPKLRGRLAAPLGIIDLGVTRSPKLLLAPEARNVSVRAIGMAAEATVAGSSFQSSPSSVKVDGNSHSCLAGCRRWRL